MINEDYCSYEVAKLLKEKGFDKFDTYGWDDQLFDKEHPRSFSIGFDDKEHWISCPTLQTALAWLRKKGIAVVPFISSVLDNKSFLWDIEIVVAKTNETYRQGWIYESYERACEAALKYVLENLI